MPAVPLRPGATPATGAAPARTSGSDGAEPDAFGGAGAVADAVLYEGYLLYPYRRSSGKNRVRWQFGVLAPREWVEHAGVDDTGVSGSADAWYQQTECLVEAADTATFDVRLRFLQVQRRTVQEHTEGGFRPVDALEVAGTRHLTFDEAVPREFDVAASIGDLRRDPVRVSVGAPGGADIEPLGTAGRMVRRRWPVSAAVRLSVEPAEAPFPLLRIRVVVENTVTSVPAGAARAEALGGSLVATHSLLRVTGGRFLSLLDPPAWSTAAAAACRNIHTFPVLADHGERDVMLSSPILMYDHPQVSPESPGDLFDATEIDEILSLRTLTLTDEEKREARATDPRAATIIDRVDAIPQEVMARLHGAVRSLRPVTTTDGGTAAREDPESSAPWWNPAAEREVSPETDAVVVGGVRVAKGSRVRLHPRHSGTDVHDMFLAGRTARVHAVLLDVDGSCHVAVTVDDDPGADLHQWYGRFHHFAPEELEPVDDADMAP